MPAHRPFAQAPARITTTFGVDAEIKELLSIADELQHETFGKVIIVEGDSGMGKSHILVRSCMLDVDLCSACS